MLLNNSAESASSGTTVSSVNSAGNRDDAFSVVTIGAGASLQFSNATSAHGSQCFAVTGASGVAAYVGYTGYNDTWMAARFYFNMGAATPGVLIRLLDVRAGTVTAVRVSLSATGTIIVHDSASTNVYSTSVIATNTWYRLELLMSVVGATGTIQFDYYLGDSTSPVASGYSTSIGNTGGSNITNVRFGSSTNTTWTGTSYFDDIALQNGSTTLSYVGPYQYNQFLLNTADGGTDTTALTTTNSGGASGNAWDQVALSGSGTVAFSATNVAHGSLSYKLSAPSGTDAISIRWASGISTPTSAVRFYLCLNSLPSGTIDIVTLRNSGGAILRYQVTSTGTLIMIDNVAGTINTFSTTPLTTTTWYRLELQAIIGTTTSNSTAAGQYFLGDSTTAIDSFTTAAANLGTTPITGVYFGKTNTNAGSLDAYLDDAAMNISRAYPIGPASAAPATGWLYQ